jgi:hypothetical protein
MAIGETVGSAQPWLQSTTISAGRSPNPVRRLNPICE